MASTMVWGESGGRSERSKGERARQPHHNRCTTIKPWWLPRANFGGAPSLDPLVFFMAFHVPIVWIGYPTRF